MISGLSGTTKVLTPHGWVLASEIGTDSLVAQFNPEDGSVDFINPTSVDSKRSTRVFEFTQSDGDYRQVVSEGTQVFIERNPYNPSLDWEPSPSSAGSMFDSGIKTQNVRFVGAGTNSSDSKFTDMDRLKVAISQTGEIMSGPEYALDGYTVVRMNTFGKGKKGRAEELLESLRIPYEYDSPKKLLIPLRGEVSVRYSDWIGLSNVGRGWALSFIEELTMWNATSYPSGSVGLQAVDQKESEFLCGIASLSSIGSGFNVKSIGPLDICSVTFNLNTSRLTAQRMIAKKAKSQMVYSISVPAGFLVTINGTSPVITGA